MYEPLFEKDLTICSEIPVLFKNEDEVFFRFSELRGLWRNFLKNLFLSTIFSCYEKNVFVMVNEGTLNQDFKKLLKISYELLEMLFSKNCLKFVPKCIETHKKILFFHETDLEYMLESIFYENNIFCNFKISFNIYYNRFIIEKILDEFSVSFDTIFEFLKKSFILFINYSGYGKMMTKGIGKFKFEDENINIQPSMIKNRFNYLFNLVDEILKLESRKYKEPIIFFEPKDDIFNPYIDKNTLNKIFDHFINKYFKNKDIKNHIINDMDKLKLFYIIKSNVIRLKSFWLEECFPLGELQKERRLLHTFLYGFAVSKRGLYQVEEKRKNIPSIIQFTPFITNDKLYVLFSAFLSKIYAFDNLLLSNKIKYNGNYINYAWQIRDAKYNGFYLSYLMSFMKDINNLLEHIFKFSSLAFNYERELYRIIKGEDR